MALDLNIDQKVKVVGEFGDRPEPIPAGEKLMFQFVAAEEPEGKTYLKLTAKCVSEGKYKGRVVFNYLNLQHAKTDVREMAIKELAAIKRAICVLNLRDKSQMLNITFVGTVGVQKGEGEYGPSNRFTKYESRADASRTQATKPAPTPAGSAADATGVVGGAEASEAIPDFMK